MGHGAMGHGRRAMGHAEPVTGDRAGGAMPDEWRYGEGEAKARARDLVAGMAWGGAIEGTGAGVL
jgi:hypothetical protein